MHGDATDRNRRVTRNRAVVRYLAEANPVTRQLMVETPNDLPTGDEPTPAVLPAVILVADDEEEMRSYICQCLESFPFEIWTAGDGLEVLVMLEEGKDRRIALVIADIYMPGVGGLELKAVLAADEQWNSVPVLLVTGEAQRSAGPLLKKPFNGDRIRKAVASLVQGEMSPHQP